MTLHEYVFMFMTIPRLFLLRMRNVSNRSFRESLNTHFTQKKFFFFENHAVHEILSKRMAPASGILDK